MPHPGVNRLMPHPVHKCHNKSRLDFEYITKKRQNNASRHTKFAMRH